jgi:hypothetical protein
MFEPIQSPCGSQREHELWRDVLKSDSGAMQKGQLIVESTKVTLEISRKPVP